MASKEISYCDPWLSWLCLSIETNTEKTWPDFFSYGSRTTSDISTGPALREMHLRDSGPQEWEKNHYSHLSLLPLTLGHWPNMLGDPNGEHGDSKLNKWTPIFPRSLECAPRTVSHQMIHALQSPYTHSPGSPQFLSPTLWFGFWLCKNTSYSIH